MGKPATHIDVHKHLHQNQNVMHGLVAAAKAKRLPVRSINPQMRERLNSEGIPTNPSFIGDAGTEAYWSLAQFKEDMQKLPEGVTEAMCHPGFTPSAVVSGYTKQREVEMQTFLHPDARATLDRLGIQLVDFSVLHG